ncbi:S-adenosyl-L-methionine-dependent methyltransferase [Xylaria intraflava]|nr:S-adenosyl-L-methionine-dependent methyltransferase [Xylaria intraflava]
MSRAADIEKLRKIVSLVTQASEAVIAEWENGTATEETSEGVQLPSHAVFNAQRTLSAAAGSVEELVSDPSTRLVTFSTQFFESRALHIVAEHRIPDILDRHGHGGAHVSVVAKEVGIEEKKLSRVLRCLTSQHILRETAPDTFANNRISQALVNNEDLRAYIMLFAMDAYTASDYFPAALTDPKFGASYKVEETAFNLALGTDLPRWSWLETLVPASEVDRLSRRGDPRTDRPDTHVKVANGHAGAKTEVLVQRPELEISARSMTGCGKVFGSAHIVDFPWATLGKATFVDVGGGIGGVPMLLLPKYPDLNFVVQDSAANVELGERIWAEKYPDALDSGRLKLMEHDFFRENPIRDAEIYWLRYITHDWSDEACITILTQIQKAMGPKSRLLIADQVMNTTLGCNELRPAPEPLLPNYGNYVRYSHQSDLAMMTILNGIERTPEQLKRILGESGLRIHKIWECRTQVPIVEAVKV